MHTDCWQHSVCTIEEEEGCGASQPFSAAITASFIVIAWHFTIVAVWLRGCPMITESAGIISPISVIATIGIIVLYSC